GDVVADDHEVLEVLGRDALAVTYLVYSHRRQMLFALKTPRNQFLRDRAANEGFRRAARAWIGLGRHPHVVRAHALDEVGPRRYLVLECVAPDGLGLVTLADHLERRPPDLGQAARWAIQLCRGLEHLDACGLRRHGDLTPASVLIDGEGAPKIVDPGMAGVLAGARNTPAADVAAARGRVGLSLQKVDGVACGTPTHTAPEQFTAGRAGRGADVYAFGVLLYQLASGGRVPFETPLPEPTDDPALRLARAVRYWREMRRAHAEAPLPGLDSPLFPIARRCLEKAPGRRYQSFTALRDELEKLLARLGAEPVVLPDPTELEAREWTGCGRAAAYLYRFEEAAACYDRALALNPHHAAGWSGRAAACRSLGRFDEALAAAGRAVALAPRRPEGWNEQGLALQAVHRHREARRCFDVALRIDPGCATTWNNLGLVELGCERRHAALLSFERATELDPRFAVAWQNRAACLFRMGRFDAAAESYERVLELEPDDPIVLFYKASSLQAAGRPAAAIPCFDRALELDPNMVEAWNNKGLSLHDEGRFEAALDCFDRALALDERLAEVWCNKGLSLLALDRPEPAVRCFDRALALDERLAAAWTGRAACLRLGSAEPVVQPGAGALTGSR
ncbi:MAG TPA: serine/threonine-protein kinase, partial [Chloroflexota bacterium]|nr:serine/threonine-protein kinase [Chloroflexota bacterium]